ncbi:MAG: hypothetical protein NTY38_32360 [Acidobacteria bacterium]|nr:hypothetical protein [Acidobacteriota bacterium]
MQFIGKLKPPEGFDHVGQHPDGALEARITVFKDVRYESFVGPDGRFDVTGFIAGFREATKALVAVEKEVDQILARLGC